MRYPEFLKENGKIGFIAPSFGCALGAYRWRFDRALLALSQKGYVPVLGENVYEARGVGISNTPAMCAKEANDFFLNDKSDVIISCGGGELMCEVLPFMDFDKIAKAKPKWFVGYSDNTNFTFLLNTLCDTAAIYGPCAGAFMDEASYLEWNRIIMCNSGKSSAEIDEFAHNEYKAARDAFDLLCGKITRVSGCDKWYEEFELENPDIQAVVWKASEVCDKKHSAEKNVQMQVNANAENQVNANAENQAYVYAESADFAREIEKNSDFTEHKYKQFLYKGCNELPEISFSGRLAGGCLDCLVNLAGTKFDKVSEFNKRYKDDGIIWFLESCDLNVMSQERSYWSLENAGWFENAAGFIIGRPRCFEDSFGELDHYKAALRIFAKYNVPIILDAPIGHLGPAVPIISGAYGKICAKKDSFEIEYGECD